MEPAPSSVFADLVVNIPGATTSPTSSERKPTMEELQTARYEEHRQRQQQQQQQQAGATAVPSLPQGAIIDATPGFSPDAMLSPSQDLADQMFSMQVAPSSPPPAGLQPPPTAALGSQPALAEIPHSQTQFVPPPQSADEDIDVFGLNAASEQRSFLADRSVPDVSSVMHESPARGEPAEAELEIIDECCANVKKNGGKHRYALEQKKVIEQQTQSWHSTLWTFPVHQNQLDGVCGCNLAVTYQFQFRVATFNQSLFQQLQAKFAELHSYNARQVFMSLYEQTYSEMQLSRAVHTRVQEIRQASDPARRRELARCLMRPLFKVLNDSTALSVHSTELVQALLLYTGSLLLEAQAAAGNLRESPSVPQAEPAADLLSIDSSASSMPTSAQSAGDVLTGEHSDVLLFLVQQLASAQGLEWGSGLLQPTIDDVMELKMLSNGLRILFQQPGASEGQFIGLLRQVPWADLHRISDVAVVREEVLNPLVNLIELAGPKSFHTLLVLVGNIFVHCACTFPDAAYEFVSAITAGRWPMKLVCSGMLQSAPLASLDREQLAQVFGHLYNLSSHLALDYSQLMEPGRQKHREDFVRYVVNFPIPQDLIRDPTASRMQPVLFILNEIAGHMQPGSYLQRLIAQELFFHAFSISVRRCAKDQSQLTIIDLWQSQAARFLKSLCKQFPVLLSTVIYCIGQTLGMVNVDVILAFLQPELFANWVADDYSVNWIANIYAQRAFPTTAPDTPLDRVAEIQFHTLLCSAPSISYSPQVAEMGRHIGQALFRAIRWSKAPPSARMIAVLTLVSGYRLHDPSWTLEALLGELGQELTAAPLSPPYVQNVLHSNVETTGSPVAVLYLQLLLGLSIVEEQQMFAREKQRPLSPSEGHQWLVGWGFYSRIVAISGPTREYIPRLLIRMDVLKEQPIPASAPVRGILQDFVRGHSLGNKAIVILQEALIESLEVNRKRDRDSNIEDPDMAQMLADERRQQRLAFWFQVLVPASRTDTTILSLLDDLIAYAYCTGDSLDVAIQNLQGMRFNRDDILYLRRGSYFWVALLLLYTFTPTYPSNNKDKQNAFFVLQETAQQLREKPAAIAYWLHLFMVYFGAPASMDVVPQAVKDKLNKHFVSLAKQFENHDPELHRLFFAFSTWKKGIIDASTGDFHAEQNIRILDSIYKLLPQRFHRNVPPPLGPSPTPAFVPTFTNATANKVLKLLPVPLPAPPRQLTKDMDRYTDLEHAISSAVGYFQDLNGHSFQEGDTIEVPASQQLCFLLAGFARASDELRNCDLEFLDLTSKSHFNYSSPFQVRVACNRGDDCKGPAILQGTSVRIEPQQPGVVQAIGSNRSSYNSKYVAFFDIARAVSQAVVLLKHSLTMSVELGLSPDIAISLFFSIAEQCIVAKVAPVDSAITRHVVDILAMLGNRYIKLNTAVQHRLLTLLLRLPPQEETTKTAALATEPPAAATMPVSSDLAEQEALRRSISIESDDKYFPERLFSFFTPHCFIQVGNSRGYLQALQTLCRSDKSDADLAPFSKCFSASDYLAVLGENPSEDDVDCVFNVLPDLLSRAAFGTIGSQFLQFLVSSGQQARVLGLLFSEHIPSEFAARFIANVTGENLDLVSSTTMLKNFVPWLPLSSGATFGVTLGLIRKFTVEMPSFVTEFRRQTVNAYDDQRRAVDSDLWNMIFSLFSRDGLMSESTPTNDQQLAEALNLLLDIVKINATGLVDKSWQLLSSSILPAVSLHSRSKGSLPTTDAVLGTFARSLPWQQSRFLFYDPNAISLMTACLQKQSTLVSGIFAVLDWAAFFGKLRGLQNKEPLSQCAVAYLRLFLSVNLVNPEAIPSSIKNLTAFVPKREVVNSVTPFVEWSSVSGDIFGAVFNGEVLFEPIKDGMVTSDPTTALMENAFMLRDVALQINDAAAGMACIREIRSLLFFCIDCSNGGYWYLPFPAHTSLITGALIPITHHFASDTRETKEMALSVVSSVLNRMWPEPYLLPIPSLSTAQSYPGRFGQAQTDEGDFYEKIKGLVLQFCGAASPILALNILRIMPLPSFNDAYDVRALTPELWTDLVEQTLRSFFMATTAADPLKEAASNLQLYMADRTAMIETARREHSGLVLVTLLQQWRDEHSSMTTSIFPPALVMSALGFAPSQYRDFDQLLMWFFVMDLVEDQRFHPTHSQNEATAFLKELHATRAPGSKQPESLQLAAHATEIYFYRLVRSKTGAHNPRADAALAKIIEDLAAFETHPDFSRFGPFFREVDELLSPLYDLQAFKMGVLRTLFPTGQMMLQRIFAPAQQPYASTS